MVSKCPRGVLSAETSARAGTRWISRIVPCLVSCMLVYATYVIVGPVCVDYLIRERHETGIAATFLVLHFLLLILLVASYARTLWVVTTEPGLVPLLPTSRGAHLLRTRHARPRKTLGAFASRYGANDDDEDRGSGGEEEAGSAAPAYAMTDQNPDSPGLENFYSRDVFVCEVDGRPKWCHDCGQWKPDRASHSQEIGRCVRKMDHFCPWVGGMVAETSFKFFAQFTFYASLFCAVGISACAYTVARQVQSNSAPSGHLVAILCLGGFLGLFSTAMTGTAVRLALTNMTNIDLLKKRMSHHLAVRVAPGTVPTPRFETITYPLQRRGPPSPPHLRQPEPEETPRDRLARRTFAVLRTDPGENPWDLGYARNWAEVMGHHPVDWFLPIKRSPCARHETSDAEYPYGPLVAELRVRNGLDAKPWTDMDDGAEMREMREPRGADGQV